MTAVPDLPLTGYAADCLLLFFAAPDVPAVALAHSGWRGTLQNMAPAVVADLRLRFGADPAAMLVALSPGICGRCYTVDRTVAQGFIKAGWRGEPHLWAVPAGRLFEPAAIIERCRIRAGTWLM